MIFISSQTALLELYFGRATHEYSVLVISGFDLAVLLGQPSYERLKAVRLA